MTKCGRRSGIGLSLASRVEGSAGRGSRPGTSTAACTLGAVLIARGRSRRMSRVVPTSLPRPPAADRFWSDAEVVLAPDDPRPGAWAGGPSAQLVDGTWWLAYRLRRPVGEGRGFANVVARSTDGVRFTPVVELGKDTFGAESLERPALVHTPEGRWRLE